MEKILNKKENDRLNKIMKDRVDLITELINEERLEYAKIETQTLKKYLDRQFKIAKKRARKIQRESKIEEELESE